MMCRDGWRQRAAFSGPVFSQRNFLLSPRRQERQGLKFDEGFRAEVLVENKVNMTLKYVERLDNAHEKRRLAYVRLADWRSG